MHGNYRGPEKIEAREVDLAWLAGIFDSEGTVSISWRKTSGAHGQWQICARIVNTYAPLMSRMKEVTGMGSISIGNRKGGTKPVYTWQLHSRRTELFLEAVLPYLVIKREVAILALEAMKIIRIAPRVRTEKHVGAAWIAPETHKKVAVIRKQMQNLNGNRNARFVKWPVQPIMEKGA